MRWRARVVWLDEVADLTKRHRERRSAGLLARGREVSVGRPRHLSGGGYDAAERFDRGELAGRSIAPVANLRAVREWDRYATPRNRKEAQLRVAAEDCRIERNARAALEGRDPSMQSDLTLEQTVAIMVLIKKRSAITSEWHVKRAAGHIARFETIKACGETDEVTTSCYACGETKSRGVRCTNRLGCRSCRKVFGNRKRISFGFAVDNLLKAADDAGYTAMKRGAFWSFRFAQKFLTLTVPHKGKSTRQRQELLDRAYGRFRAALRRDTYKRAIAQARRDGLMEPMIDELDNRSFIPPRLLEARHPRAWAFVKPIFGEPGAPGIYSSVRVKEWTPGSDGQGNSHVHMWIFAPLLDKARLEYLWARALTQSGHHFDGDDRTVIIDIRKVDQDLPTELFKYLTKEIVDGTTRYVAPATYAAVYELFDGKRQIQGSRGFFGRAGEFVAACECGAEGCFSIRFRKTRPADAEQARIEKVEGGRRIAGIRKVGSRDDDDEESIPRSETRGTGDRAARAARAP